MNQIWYYIIGINLFSFFLMGWDKYSAIKNLWRVSENNLLGVSLIGGGVGSLLGMILFHHKTKKKRFQIGIPLTIIINIYIFSKIL